MVIKKTKFILTTKLLFLISFCLYTLYFITFSVPFLLYGIYVLGNYQYYQILLTTSNLFSLFFLAMPIIRFVINFRKIKTEDDKKSVSGFYLRYFMGIIAYLVANFAVLFVTVNPTYLILLSGFIMFTFFYLSIFTLKGSIR